MRQKRRGRSELLTKLTPRPSLTFLLGPSETGRNSYGGTHQPVTLAMARWYRPNAYCVSGAGPAAGGTTQSRLLLVKSPLAAPCPGGRRQLSLVQNAFRELGAPSQLRH